MLLLNRSLPGPATGRQAWPPAVSPPGCPRFPEPSALWRAPPAPPRGCPPRSLPPPGTELAPRIGWRRLDQGERRSIRKHRDGGSPPAPPPDAPLRPARLRNHSAETTTPAIVPIVLPHH